MSHDLISVTCWNIEGLNRLSQNETFISSLKRYDIIGLVETWTTDLDICKSFVDSNLEGYDSVGIPAQRVCSRGRPSGGILVIFKHELKAAITTMATSKHTIWIKLSNNYFNWEKDLYLATVYIPPKSSNYYDDQFTEIEHKIAQYSNNGNILLMGDTNARTKNKVDFIVNDTNEFMDLPEDYTFDTQKPRNSMDLHGNVTQHGKLLLDLCIASQLRILNGRTKGDTLGAFTYFDNKGSSTIDYFICSEQFQSQVMAMRIHPLSYVSKHCQIGCFLTCSKQTRHPSNSVKLTPAPQINKINQNKKHEYIDMVLSQKSIEQLTNIMSKDFTLTQAGVDDLTQQLTNIMVNSAQMVSLPYKKPTKKLKTNAKPFFDNECYQMRRYLIDLGKKISKNPADMNLRHHFNKQKRLYQRMLKTKKKTFKQNLINKLSTISKNNTKETWSILEKINSLESGKTTVCNGPTHSALYDHYKDLNIHKQSSHTDAEVKVELKTLESASTNKNSELDNPITIKEIKQIVHTLKNNKSPGPDQITNEMIKFGKGVLLGPLAKLFNLILDTQSYPSQWSKGYLVSIPKAGDKTLPENGRGLTLLSCLSKLFTKLINNRLVDYLEKHKILSDAQSGFRKNRQTTDNLFITKALVDKYIKQSNKKLHFCFIDFRKAFDTIWYPGLFLKLLRNKVSGKFYNTIKQMYSNIQLQIKHKGMLSPSFTSNTGVRQGDNLSPTLFNLYINDLEFDHVTSDTPILSNTHISHLLYADDLLLISQSPKGLQNSINMLNQFCQKWHLTLNIKKTKIMTVQNRPSKNTTVYKFGEQAIEHCSSYKYLGLIINDNGSYKLAKEELRSKAIKALHKLEKMSSNCNFPLALKMKLFDTLVKPVLLYNSEIWALDPNLLTKDKDTQYWLNVQTANKTSYEQVHQKFCKMTLRVPKRTSHIASKAELGRYPLLFDIITKCSKYEQKLKITENTLLQDAYIYYNTKSTQKHNWLYTLSQFKQKAGIENLIANTKRTSLNKRVNSTLQKGYQQFFKHSVKQDLHSGKLTVYNHIQTEYKIQDYLMHTNNIEHRKTITKLRTSSHKLEIETGRIKNMPRDKRICQICKTAVEDELHFIMKCPYIQNDRDNLRTHLIQFGLPFNMDNVLNPTQQTSTMMAHLVYDMYQKRIAWS